MVRKITLDYLTGLESKVGKVIKKNKDGTYIVKINQEEWVAEAKQPLKVGDTIKVLSNGKGVVLKVSKEEGVLRRW